MDAHDDSFRIGDAEWEHGWRHEFRSAVDKALEGHPDGTEARIEEIWVIKRGNESYHDYRIVLNPNP